MFEGSADGRRRDAPAEKEDMINTNDRPAQADLFKVAESHGVIRRWRVGREHRVLCATVPQSTTEETRP